MDEINEMNEQPWYRTTMLTGTKKFLSRCIVKISYDGGKTYLPKGPYELHIAGETYVLLTNGRYERLT